MKNARFWVFANGGPVKITLRPGQSLVHETGGPTDEGWFHDHHRIWTYETDDGGVIVRNWSTDGQDCDGRHGNGGCEECPLAELRAGNEPCYTDLESWEDPDTWRGVIWPAWREVSIGTIGRVLNHR